MGRERRKTPALPAVSQLIFKHFRQSWDLLSRVLWKNSAVFSFGASQAPRAGFTCMEACAQLCSPPLAQQRAPPLQITLILIRLWQIKRRINAQSQPKMFAATSAGRSSSSEGHVVPRRPRVGGLRRASTGRVCKFHTAQKQSENCDH